VSFAVVDASVMVAFYVADEPRRVAVVERLTAGDQLFSAALLDAEVLSALRGLARRTPALGPSVPGALRHLAAFAIRRVPLAPLLERMWQLRDNITPYDAAYVALAEELRCPVITCDAKLAAGSGSRCSFDVLG
jgi:predicted nucleic acid-binding protein